jgi:hypothetical protein
VSRSTECARRHGTQAVDSLSLADRQHGWIWAALPTGCRHPRVVEFGRPPTGTELDEAVSQLGTADALLVAWPGERRRAAPALRRLRSTGLEGERLTIAKQTVVAAARTRAPSLLDAISNDAARAVGIELKRRSVTSLSTGTTLVDLRGPSGERFALRLAGGPAAVLLERSIDAVASLVGPGVTRGVRERVPAQLASGVSGPVSWTLELWARGRHPRRLSAALWDECLEFLASLHAAPRPRGAPDWSLAPDFAAIARHADADGRRTLARLESMLERQLAGLPRGWMHGDFWPANLVASAGCLTAVLDWDSATPSGLPLLDLMHLLLMSDRRARRLPHGQRSLQVLLPLAQNGGDARMRRYCALRGAPAAARALEPLALAYWVSRTGRDLRTFANRPSRPDWMRANVHTPIAEVARSGHRFFGE